MCKVEINAHSLTRSLSLYFVFLYLCLYPSVLLYLSLSVPISLNLSLSIYPNIHLSTQFSVFLCSFSLPQICYDPNCIKIPKQQGTKCPPSLVGHGELVGLLLVAAGELVVDPRHQVLVYGVLDRILEDVHPPRGAQVHLQNKRHHFDIETNNQNELK